MDSANKEILIDEAVAKLKHFAQLYGIKSLFVVGGFCRDYFFNRLELLNDIDVASSYEDQTLQLAGLFASEILHTTPEVYKRSGAAAVNYRTDLGEVKIEFQGRSVNPYMYNQEVRNWMHANDIEDVPLMNNIYGRDFTINSLIYSLHDGNLYDPTDRAVPALNEKRIISLLPAKMLIKYNPLAILRAIRFALTYDFLIDPELKKAMKNQKEALSKSLSEERIIKEIVRILRINAKEALEMLKEFELSDFLLTPDIKEYLKNGEEKND